MNADIGSLFTPRSHRGTITPMRRSPPVILVLLILVATSGCASLRNDARERNPIVFVHGWSSSASVWTTMIERFRSDGWPKTHLVSWSYDTGQSNAETARQLADHVEAVLDETGARRVDIVSHSMGALPARYYARFLGGDARIDGWVSLGGPSHGTLTAFACIQRSCREMWLESSFLRDLNEGDETPGRPRYATWRSPCDFVIIPQNSPVLDGAVNEATSCLLHLELPTDATVYTQVRDWLSANESGAAYGAW